ncbi:hypothetical protein RI367_005524 [Sorochytrium milnesiophthora]
MKLEFPVQGLLPKEETEASSFLRKFPEYDGRNAIIAVLDTGVDPGAPGLAVTTDGKPKIVDIVDCTGSGDVSMSAAVKSKLTKDDATGENVQIVNGLSGRRLVLNPEWKNPSGEYRLGVKRAFELFPGPVLSRVKELRKEKFMTEHGRLVADVQAELSALDGKSSSSSDDEANTAKADLQARLDALKSLVEKYEDPGAVYDCVVFFDGEHWRAVVDTQESGDLRKQPALASYRFEQQHHRFGDQDNLNFSVNVYDEGATLSIVTVAGSHGTHVAAIAAAHHPEEPALNGIAPGAQVVSLKIGDTRLGSMETGPGLSRAVLSMVQNKCDLANISYGEAVNCPNVGRFTELLRDVAINQHGVIVVSSAGNAGPALTTVGAPGGPTGGVISVGAHVGHNQMAAEYALLQNVPEREYTWSSRGPTHDGASGTTIYAPGSAITSVPTYQLQKTQLMNGTSMSSPNACGNLALLVSGWKKECGDKKLTPYRVTQAITNSGVAVPSDPFKTPFLQVDKAFSHLIKYKDCLDQDLHYAVSLPNGMRGVYLREVNETNRVFSANATVTPTFSRLPDKPDWQEYWQESQTKTPLSLPARQSLNDSNNDKLDFDMRLALVATKPWVKAPAFVHFNTGGRTVPIQVDPTALAPGLHVAEIQAWDTANHDKGILFKIPVAVCKPERPLVGGVIRYDNVAFSAGQIERKFIAVPDGAVFADLTVRSTSPTGQLTPARFTIQMIQLLPGTRYVKHEHEFAYALGNESYLPQGEAKTHEVRRIKVVGGVTMEMCLAQFWSSPSEHNVSVEMVFHGAELTGAAGGDTSFVWINGNDAITRIDVASTLRREEDVSLSGSFETLRKSIRPSDSAIRPLSATRDVMPNTRQVYNLLLNYTVKTTEANTSITPRIPALTELLYDSPHDGILLMVYDVNKRLLATHDVYPKQIKLEAKGEYTIRVQVRHEAIDYLERLQNLVLCIDYAVKAVSLDFITSRNAVLQGKKASFSKQVLEVGDRRAVFVATPDSLPKEAKPGDVLYGDLTVNEGGKTKVEGGCYRVAMVVPPEKPTPKEANTGAASGKQDDAKTQYAEAVRDLKITWLKKASGDMRAALIKELQDDHAAHLPALVTRLEVLSESDSADKAAEVRALADQILTVADASAVAAYFALKQDTTSDADKKKQKKDFEKRKDAITAALYRKALASQELAAKQSGASSDAFKQFDADFAAYQQWALPASAASDAVPDANYLKLAVFRERTRGKPGAALKAVVKYLGEAALAADTKDDVKNAWKQKQELLDELGWTAWTEYEKRWQMLRVQSDFAPF